MLLRTLKSLSTHSRHDRRPAVRPTLVLLEDRTVPTAVIADIPGSGLYRVDPNAQTYQLINGFDPSATSKAITSGSS